MQPRPMRSLHEMLNDLQARDDCVFRPPTGLPKLPGGLKLPDDMAKFYARFSEAYLFGRRSDPRYHILPPEEFTQIGVAIFGEESPAPIQKSWYALAHVQDGNYIAIDCGAALVGYCYDAFHETFSELSYCKVIARSFTELMNVAASAGDTAWWINNNFEGYGYADKLVSRPAE